MYIAPEMNLTREHIAMIRHAHETRVHTRNLADEELIKLGKPTKGVAPFESHIAALLRVIEPLYMPLPLGIPNAGFLFDPSNDPDDGKDPGVCDFLRFMKARDHFAGAQIDWDGIEEEYYEARDAAGLDIVSAFAGPLPGDDPDFLEPRINGFTADEAALAAIRFTLNKSVGPGGVCTVCGTSAAHRHTDACVVPALVALKAAMDKEAGS